MRNEATWHLLNDEEKEEARIDYELCKLYGQNYLYRFTLEEIKKMREQFIMKDVTPKENKGE